MNMEETVAKAAAALEKVVDWAIDARDDVTLFTGTADGWNFVLGRSGDDYDGIGTHETVILHLPVDLTRKAFEAASR